MLTQEMNALAREITSAQDARLAETARLRKSGRAERDARLHAGRGFTGVGLRFVARRFKQAVGNCDPIDPGRHPHIASHGENRAYHGSFCAYASRRGTHRTNGRNDGAYRDVL